MVITDDGGIGQDRPLQQIGIYEILTILCNLLRYNYFITESFKGKEIEFSSVITYITVAELFHTYTQWIHTDLHRRNTKAINANTYKAFEDLESSIFLPIYPTTWRKAPKYSSFNIHCCSNYWNLFYMREKEYFNIISHSASKNNIRVVANVLGLKDNAMKTCMNVQVKLKQ
jgi:hypothetical protein